ncbi:ATP synthase F1, epsilon subunit [Rubrobacter radiotolerans]|uniref:ATP synthase epsilon chain n=1 Tax=Rubrobacter radiotolerans TaxID=42256 RepID=A0A023X3T5_RUBRA|nr:ATP synthase F1 subunit epsilon [Rubrobacter radiotolerans]AHY46861.1 ATP synthase F1, epsilon subunit [Rubrobacter radiotolerans]MDX5894266.1 ATP synthase F1 subunit epsilon [Rubrobacter radiotolerans]SMC05601.1 ATP synthase F1 subcomplex epsilon subunit [Rubrobacter radiotolerans DSM 5868]
MAERQLFCRIITPERTVFDGEVEMVKLRIADGDIGVMSDHQPIVSTVGIRDVQVVMENDERQIFATSDGFFKVSDNLVQILVEEAVPAEEIDPDVAGNRIEDAERLLAETPEDEENERRRRELERERLMGENLARIHAQYTEGQAGR